MGKELTLIKFLLSVGRFCNQVHAFICLIPQACTSVHGAGRKQKVHLGVVKDMSRGTIYKGVVEIKGTKKSGCATQGLGLKGSGRGWCHQDLEALSPVEEFTMVQEAGKEREDHPTASSPEMTSHGLDPTKAGGQGSRATRA